MRKIFGFALALSIASGASQVDARYLQADSLGLADGPSVYGYAHQNPVNNTDPTGQYCLTMNGQTTCRSPGGTNVSWPTQPGWGPSSYIGPDTRNYHYYDKSSLHPDRTYDVDCLLQGLISGPEPLPSNGASYGGTRNYANPWIAGGGFSDRRGINPVTSFIVTDANSGSTGIANVTNTGHTLSTGYVARFPTRNGIRVVGEGSGILQHPWNPTRFPINSVWGPANERIMEQCLCEN
ncbi:RHS repeat-associated core domain-containing protein [Thalassovita taeanensis]|uniref:RHS repeat-associated core domain-containing protein n=1 Tax=Thalassovita taeanensis TaxID=657014 RepID=A0A1H9LF98_9RHOB|nr:RHS repeat-associated core domain-containing protein [Thalassovita taeanensis]